MEPGAANLCLSRFYELPSITGVCFRVVFLAIDDQTADRRPRHRLLPRVCVYPAACDWSSSALCHSSQLDPVRCHEWARIGTTSKSDDTGARSGVALTHFAFATRIRKTGVHSTGPTWGLNPCPVCACSGSSSRRTMTNPSTPDNDPYSLFETFQAPIDGAASQSIADQLAAMQHLRSVHYCNSINSEIIRNYHSEHVCD